MIAAEALAIVLQNYRQYRKVSYLISALLNNVLSRLRVVDYNHNKKQQFGDNVSAAAARLRGGYRWACLYGTPGKHPSNLLTTTKKTRQAPPRPLQQLPLHPRQQVPPLGEP